SQRVANKNILLITIESLRADVLNEKNMPFTYSLSQHGLNYTNHFSGASNRAQGIYSLFYGLPNRYWPEITLNYVPPVLMTRLQDQNYQFGLFSSIGFVHPEFLQSSFSQLDKSILQPSSNSGTNEEITQAWKQWLSDTDDTKNWFSFLYYHQSGDALSLDDNNFSIAQRTEKMALYQQQVLDIDLKIKQIIENLKISGQFKDSIVIITGTDGASFEKSSSAQAAINNAHVPLVIFWPGENSRSITRMTSHVDIAPTLMEGALGVQTKAQQYSDGQSLFDNKARPYLLSGDLRKHVIYEQDKITQFNNDGQISSINWQGINVDEDEFDITLLIDVLSKLRRFND
ncbi:MAG: sulfatase-like hydrolase/transferase, partial [Psychromonas sp.]|nr:sulfatase-like hydrolase/transferase [Psychromonas sp.]